MPLIILTFIVQCCFVYHVFKTRAAGLVGLCHPRRTGRGMHCVLFRRDLSRVA